MGWVGTEGGCFILGVLVKSMRSMFREVTVLDECPVPVTQVGHELFEICLLDCGTCLLRLR